MFILAPLFYYNFLKMRYTSRRNPSVRLVRPSEDIPFITLLSLSLSRLFLSQSSTCLIISRLVFSELHQSASYIAAHQNCPSFISSVIYKLDAFITRLNPMTPPQPPPTN